MGSLKRNVRKRQSEENREEEIQFHPLWPSFTICDVARFADCYKTLQELRMLSSVTLNCLVTDIVMNSGSQLSEL